jgi:CheY-like chemotaxis protein
MPNDPVPAGHVLVIEDDADIRDFIELVLADDGYTVTLAEHGAAALDVLAQARRLPDLIVLDLQMPIMDGRAFRRAQQADPRWRTIPVILMSASAGFDTAAQELDVATILRKPFLPDALLALVTQVCAAAPARAV